MLMKIVFVLVKSCRSYQGSNTLIDPMQVKYYRDLTPVTPAALVSMLNLVSC